MSMADGPPGCPAQRAARLVAAGRSVIRHVARQMIWAWRSGLMAEPLPSRAANALADPSPTALPASGHLGSVPPRWTADSVE